MLAYVAGVALMVCVVMAVYWSMQRTVPAGFDLWTASAAIVAAAGLILVGRENFPADEEGNPAWKQKYYRFDIGELMSERPNAK